MNVLPITNPPGNTMLVQLGQVNPAGQKRNLNKIKFGFLLTCSCWKQCIHYCIPDIAANLTSWKTKTPEIWNIKLSITILRAVSTHVLWHSGRQVWAEAVSERRERERERESRASDSLVSMSACSVSPTDWTQLTQYNRVCGELDCVSRLDYKPYTYKTI